MITAFQRGHPIVYTTKWIYQDTLEPISIERPCIRCGRMPTGEGHDYCLGNLKDVKSACCGHGTERPYRIWSTKGD